MLETSLPFNSSLRILNLEGNEGISQTKLKEIERAIKPRSLFNLVSVYLLGYADTGKTTLLSTLKNLNFVTKLLFSKTAKTTIVNERTKGLEVDKRIPIGDGNFMQVIDFGGQHQYHHITHLFSRGYRAAFIILINPFEDGFGEQLWYWLRLLTLKSVASAAPVSRLPQVVIVFSRRDEGTGTGTGKGKGEGKIKEVVDEKEKELGVLVTEAERVFGGWVKVRGWVWMDCTQTKNKDLERFFSMLSGLVSSVMDEFQMAVPDTSIPEKIIKATEGEMFYDRGDLEGFIMTKVLKQSGDSGLTAASNWIDSLLRCQDYFSVRVKQGKQQTEFICTDLQKFGRELLSNLIELRQESKSEWTQAELEGFLACLFLSSSFSHFFLSSLSHADKFKDLDPSKKWIGSLPLILCSLHLCVLNTNQGSTVSPFYIIPCSIVSHHKDKVKELWMPPTTTSSSFLSPSLSSPTAITPLPHYKSVSEGRRLRVSSEQQMFHPAFLPQLTCHLLSLIPFSGSPVIWQGGVVFKTMNGQCLVARCIYCAQDPTTNGQQATW